MEAPFDPDACQRAFEAALDALFAVVDMAERLEGKGGSLHDAVFIGTHAEAAELTALELGDECAMLYGVDEISK